MFLDSDKEPTDQELYSFSDNLEKAILAFMRSDFKDSAIHLENAKQSVEALQTYKNNKQSHDQAEFILNQIKSDKDMAKMIVESYK